MENDCSFFHVETLEDPQMVRPHQGCENDLNFMENCSQQVNLIYLLQEEEEEVCGSASASLLFFLWS